jgi:hypothetical protein
MSASGSTPADLSDPTAQQARASAITAVVQELGGAPETLIEVLHRVQPLEGYLSRSALHQVAQELRLPLSRVYGVASFYHLFERSAPAPHRIAVCRGTSLVGAGTGQTSRVDSVRIALEKAGERARGAVLASDAFFPFPDSIDLIARAGIAAVVQPGGSKRDGEVIAAADAAGIPMVFTDRRHFRH